MQDKTDAPSLSFPAIFKLFFGFGLRAWGGPVAQIALIKDQLVLQEKWITVKRFNRVLAVYQALPGPEATELCCYFGYLAGGRVGSVIAGFAFVLPGFALMLLLSWLYTDYGLQNHYFVASLKAVHPTVVALVFRAVPKIGEHAVTNEDHSINYVLLWIACFSAIQSVAFVPFYFTLFYSTMFPLAVAAKLPQCCCCFFSADKEAPSDTVMEVVDSTPPISSSEPAVSNGDVPSSKTPNDPTKNGSPVTAAKAEVPKEEENSVFGILLSSLFTICCIIGYVLYCVYRGIPGNPAIGFGHASPSNINGAVFLVGLMGGLLTFGGAYTAIPFVREESVVIAKWLVGGQFLDGLAIGQMIPAPLVIFSTFVGFQANRFPGAILCTMGMFIPAFSFTAIGHLLFERLVDYKPVNKALDGLSACVVGLVAVTALQLLKDAVTHYMQAVIFLIAVMVVFSQTNSLTSLCMVMCAIVAGQVLFTDRF